MNAEGQVSGSWGQVSSPTLETWHLATDPIVHGQPTHLLKSPCGSAPLYLVLWLLLWAGYNTVPWLVLEPTFPTSTVQLVHGLRAFFPVLSGWLALTLMLARGGVKKPALLGPLGLLGFYTAIGLTSSLFCSPDPFGAIYWGVVFGCPLAILMLTLSDAQSERAMSRLLALSWIIAIVMVVGIVLGLPIVGGPSLMPTEGGLLPATKGGWTTSNIAGMAGPRGTGLARYAAVAALAALSRLGQGRKWVQPFWILTLPLSLYVLMAANGRSEIVAFIVAACVLLMVRRTSRYVMLTWGLMAIFLMARAGIFERLWQYGTRTGHFDPTLTGRTIAWQQGWEAIATSPLVGLGFQADRYFIAGAHIHNGLLHALLQSGVIGTVAFVAAYAVAWAMMVQLYLMSRGPRRVPLAAEFPAVLVFFTLLNVTESVAYFSANWLFLAPVLAWLQLTFWKHKAAPRIQDLGFRTPC